MRAKWRKIIWAILAVQLLLVHLMIFQNRYLGNFIYRAVRHFGLSELTSVVNWNIPIICMWLGSGCVVMFLHYLHYLRFRRACIGRITPVSEPWILESMQQAIEETELHKRDYKHFLYYNNDIRDPFVIGFREPILLLPEQEYERRVLPFIFLHECNHIRHRDTLYKLFMLFMQSLMWFQPLMYLLKAVSYMDIEVACDEAVIEGKDMEARKAYGMALLESLQKGRSTGQMYSAYFYHGAYLMRARIKAVMNERKHWDYFAIAGILVLLMEVLYSGYRIGHRWYDSYQAQQKELTALIYDGYEIPECFTHKAADSMLALTPVAENAYYDHLAAVNEYERLEYNDLPYEADGPWQVRLEDADSFQDAVSPLMLRYLYYYIDQEWATKWDVEVNGSSPLVETVYSRWLAGSKDNAVFAVICRQHVGDEEELSAFPELLADRAQFTYEQGSYYAYFEVALQVRMVQDYIFELEGIADLEEIVTAYQTMYPRTDYANIPKTDLVYLVDREEIIRADRLGKPWQIERDTNADILRVSGADGIMQEVPVPLSEILDRGDQMDGKLTSLQEGSYQVDENKIIFAYGGSGTNPFSVVFYEEESGSFKKSVVTNDYYGGRKIFVDFPENSQEGFMIVTGERIVWQEATILFHTTDGGKSWQEVGPAGPNFYEESHSLTVDAGFVSNEVGFLTIRDPDTPEIWRTADGGLTWAKQKLPFVQEYHGMAYMPVKKEGILTLYVGMESYTKYGGTKAKYESTDEGATWKYCGLVLRK